MICRLALNGRRNCVVKLLAYGRRTDVSVKPSIARRLRAAGLGGEVEPRETADGVFACEGAAADAEHRQREMRGPSERCGAHLRALHSCEAKP